MRTIIVGDIHGCFRELMELLKKIKFNKESDQMISLGDLMDRGGQSYEVFDYSRNLKAFMGDRCVILRGNHEQMMIDAMSDPKEGAHWLRNGAMETVRSFYDKKKYICRYTDWFLDNTVLFYEEERFRCVHGGLEQENLSENIPRTLIWDRTRVSKNDYGGKLTLIGHTPALDATWYAGDQKTTAALSERKPLILPIMGLICLDTGCVFGRRLTAMVLEGEAYWLDSTCRIDSV